MTPTVGRIVHYTDPHSSHRCMAALVVREREDGRADLAVFDPTGEAAAWWPAYVPDAWEAPAGSRGWHWPEGSREAAELAALASTIEPYHGDDQGDDDDQDDDDQDDERATETALRAALGAADA